METTVMSPLCTGSITPELEGAPCSRLHGDRSLPAPSAPEASAGSAREEDALSKP